MISALDSAVLTEFPELHIPDLFTGSDNGSHLTSRRYEEYIRALNISCDTTHANTPREDGHVESYFDHLKED